MFDPNDTPQDQPSVFSALSRIRPTRGLMVMGAGLSLAAMAVSALLPNSGSDAQAAIAPLAPAPITEADIFAELAMDDAGADTLSLKLKPGDSLGPLLMKNGVSPGTAYKVTQAFAKSYDPRHLRAGQTINLHFDDDTDKSLVSVSLKPNFERTIFVNRAGDDFTSRDMPISFPKELVQVSGNIENSLYLDAGRLGVPDKVTVQFSQIYEHSVDFQRDIRAGDSFSMAFYLYRDERGNPMKAGDLLYTSFSPRGKTMDYWLYKTKAGHENYYDAKGKGAKRKLMRTPINGARLSSGYGRRKHPVLGYTKKHNGVDFAARRGTPIMAAGLGTIERANRWSSFGNYVRIRHSDGYKTAYAHLKGFAKGIRKGARVRQGQIIGYVGTTGRSTGPHLHYEVHKNGRAINPRSLSTLSGKPLPKGETDRFKSRRTEIERLRKDAPPALPPVDDAILVVDNETAINETAPTP